MESSGVTVPAPHGLEVGGQALWEAATKAKQFHPGELVVLEEACRIKDRADLFNALLIGDEKVWFHLRPTDKDGKVVAIVVDSVLTEARLHAGELRQLIEKLRLPLALAGEAPKEAVDDPLAAARSAREARLRGTGSTG